MKVLEQKARSNSVIIKFTYLGYILTLCLTESQVADCVASNLPEENLKPAFQRQVSTEEFKSAKYFESANRKGDDSGNCHAAAFALNYTYRTYNSIVCNREWETKDGDIRRGLYYNGPPQK